MFTDMVGYSALAQRNETLALDLLDEHRKILRPFFSKHNGREIETVGDAFFVEFNSAVEAANCAIEIQTTLNERNKGEAPERHILLRIGLHIGDVVYMDTHVHGDGVNIAARIEPLAQPGGICMSEDMARQIGNKISYPVVKLGEEKLKNISTPMAIYCITLPWSRPEKLKRTRRLFVSKKTALYGGGLLGLLVIGGILFLFGNRSHSNGSFSKLRLAVLPLANISKDSGDEYFADGMTEELISSLSKIGGLNVIARTSSMKYKTTDKDISQIGRELMVGTILEGSVRKTENAARITVQLINVSTQDNIWSMEYDKDLKDIFRTQSEIAQNVANELKVRLLTSEREQLEKNSTENRIAFEEYLIGKHFLNQKTPESIQAALVHFENSIAEDSAFALPYASIAYCYTLIGVAGYGSLPGDVAETKAMQAVMKALQIDSTLAEAHAALGYIKFRFDWDWKKAEKELTKAIELKPGYATAHEWYGLLLALNSRLDQALKEMQTAYLLDPLSPSVNTGIARIYHFRNENDKAVSQALKTLALDSNYAEAHYSLGMTYYKLKEYDKSEGELKIAIQLSQRRPVMLGMLGAVYLKEGKVDEAKAILSELNSPPMNYDKLYAVAIVKSNMGEPAEALDILQRLFDARYGILIYLKVNPDFFENIDPVRFQQFVDKMKFDPGR